MSDGPTEESAEPPPGVDPGEDQAAAADTSVSDGADSSPETASESRLSGPPDEPETDTRTEVDATPDGTDRPPGVDADGDPRAHDGDTLAVYTTERRSLAPHVKLQWGVWTTIGVAVLTAIATTVAGALSLDPRLGVLFLVVFFALGIALVTLRYRRWTYQIQTDALYLERGVVRHVRTLVPYVRIQHVDTSRGPFERALGLSTLVVYTAGSRGADVSIPGLEPAEARDLQQRVKELAIEADGGDAL